MLLALTCVTALGESQVAAGNALRHRRNMTRTAQLACLLLDSFVGLSGSMQVSLSAYLSKDLL